MKKPELLAPAGNFSKLLTAVYFGADAVYIGGKHFSLRALSENFTDEEIVEAVKFAHKKGVKIYVTVNIFAKNYDFEELEKYLVFLQDAEVDAILVTDVGVVSLAKKVAPKLHLHLSTQANTLNKYAVKFWKDLGFDRVVVARELSLKEIKDITDYCPDIEIEAFVHGAMCISYSGRCLLSNYFNGRDANRGECVQACRWNYEIRERSKDGDFYPVEEDDRGTYIFNSKDLNMIDYLPEMAKSGVVSLKIEGRMKSEYYLATVINAYRRAIDAYYNVGEDYDKDGFYYNELLKTSHRAFTTAYFLGDNENTVNYKNSQSEGTRQFIANVTEGTCDDGFFIAEMRNRFKVGDTLEILSPSESFNETFVVKRMEDMDGNSVEDAKLVQQKLKIFSDIKVYKGDFLRK